MDPKRLFQRLVTAGDHADELPYLFKFELYSYPSALFESSHIPFQANKSVLADAVCIGWWCTVASHTMAHGVT